MRTDIKRITKRRFYALGGFANPALFRKATRSGSWQYFIDHSRNAH